MKRLIVIAASLAFSASAAAQMYKWKDKDGHTRYGDVPPPGAEATAIGGRSRAAPAAPAADAKSDKGEKSEKALTPEQAFRKRQQDRAAADEKAAKERNESAEKQQNCAQAQRQLATLQSGQRIATVDAAGERSFMDDSQKAAETSRAEKAVADWCS